MNDTQIQLYKDDLKGYFNSQWKTHREDQRLGQWTNMSLIGVEADGTFSSVKVNQIRSKKFNFCIFLFPPFQVHQAIILPLCENLAKAVADGGPEDLVILLADTPAQSIRDLVHYIYQGGFVATSAQNVLDFIKLLRNLGLPLSSLTRVNKRKRSNRNVYCF